MLYRKRVLLALVETFGLGLTRTDFQMLLLLFCKSRDHAYYDFFPHYVGGLSFLAIHDHDDLVESGYLEQGRDFKLRNRESYVKLLGEPDQRSLSDLRDEVGKLRGSDLLHKAYLDYPHFASRSRIAPHVLSIAELSQVRSALIKNTEPRLFSIGYEGLSIDAYLNSLVSHNIALLVDVRSNPLSRKFGFSKKRLAEYTRRAGVRYIHIPVLGVPSAVRRSLDTPESYELMLQTYEAETLPMQSTALNQLKSLLHKYERVALTCFEADYHFCHRHRITEYFASDPEFTIPVKHL